MADAGIELDPEDFEPERDCEAYGHIPEKNEFDELVCIACGAPIED